jgi:hypothetical protein
MFANLDQLSEDLRSKLKDAQEVVAHGRRMIQLYDIPALAQEPLQNMTLNCNFSLYEKILLEDHGFQSMQKALKELKNKRTLPQQESLF